VWHLHSQLFMNSHFHFLITVELTTIYMLFQQGGRSRSSQWKDGNNCCVWQHCVALHHAEGSHLVTFHLFVSMKQHFGGCQFHNNREAEMVILNGFEYRNHFVQEQKLHPIENLYLPGHPMATVILRDIT